MAYAIMKATRCEDDSWQLTDVGQVDTEDQMRNAILLCNLALGDADTRYEGHAIDHEWSRSQLCQYLIEHHFESAQLWNLSDKTLGHMVDDIEAHDP